MEDKNLKWIRDIRDNNYELTKEMTEEDRKAYYNEKYRRSREMFVKSMKEKELIINH